MSDGMNQRMKYDDAWWETLDEKEQRELVLLVCGHEDAVGTVEWWQNLPMYDRHKVLDLVKDEVEAELPEARLRDEDQLIRLDMPTWMRHVERRIRALEDVAHTPARFLAPKEIQVEGAESPLHQYTGEAWKQSVEDELKGLQRRTKTVEQRADEHRKELDALQKEEDLDGTARGQLAGRMIELERAWHDFEHRRADEDMDEASEIGTLHGRLDRLETRLYGLVVTDDPKRRTGESLPDDPHARVEEAMAAEKADHEVLSEARVLLEQWAGRGYAHAPSDVLKKLREMLVPEVFGGFTIVGGMSTFKTAGEALENLGSIRHPDDGPWWVVALRAGETTERVLGEFPLERMADGLCEALNREYGAEVASYWKRGMTGSGADIFDGRPVHTRGEGHE